MCCFSQPVELVSDTNIFARSVNGRQFLVYSMTYAAAADLAMVLPLPIPPNPPEDAVRFINLERYRTFFDDMRRGFARPESDSFSLGTTLSTFGAPMLQVHDVGSFEASFVPRIDDFHRLDDRFRIPRDVWEGLPVYHDYGFAVFKLKGTAVPHSGSSARGSWPSSPKPGQPERGVRGFLRSWLGSLFRRAPERAKPERRRIEPAPLRLEPEPRHVHPMAFEFPRRNPDLLYFPTVHVHDRKVHPRAMFDHMLYCQPDREMDEYLQDWEKSYGPVSKFMNVAATEGIVDPNHHCWVRSLEGRLENRDVLVGKGGSGPELLAV